MPFLYYLHKFIATIFIGVFILFMQACQSDHEKIKGHWHEVNPEDKVKIYHTWDITDRTIIMNDADSPFADTTLYFIHNGNLFWGEIKDDIKLIYNFEHDTLILKRDSEDYKTYLVKKYHCTPKEHFSNYWDLQLNIDLPYSSQAKEIDGEEYDLANIFVGKQRLIPGQKSGDSISIQVNDVLIDYSDISNFLDGVHHIHTPKLSTALYIDKNTPMYIVDRVKYEIASSRFRVIHFMSIKDTLHANFYQGIGILLPPVCQHKATYYRQPLPDPDISYQYSLDGISKPTYCMNEAILNHIIDSSQPLKIFAVKAESTQSFSYQKFDSNKEYRQAILEDSFGWEIVTGQKLAKLTEDFILDNRKNYFISFHYNGKTDYDTYIRFQTIIMKALNELRNEYALFYLHKPYDTLTETELTQVYTFYPKRMMEMDEDELLYLKKDLK